MRWLCAAVLIGALTSGVGAAADKGKEAPPAKSLLSLAACRDLRDPAERLACYDREVAALDDAVKNKKVVVLDQEQVRETRRSLFGFTLPSLRLFGGGRDRDGAERDEMRQLDTTIATITRLGDGRVSFTVADGARWIQTDDREVLIARVKPGTPVKITRGTLGSYFASIKGTIAFKAERRN